MSSSQGIIAIITQYKDLCQRVSILCGNDYFTCAEHINKRTLTPIDTKLALADYMYGKYALCLLLAIIRRGAPDVAIPTIDNTYYSVYLYHMACS